MTRAKSGVPRPGSERARSSSGKGLQAPDLIRTAGPEQQKSAGSTVERVTDGESEAAPRFELDKDTIFSSFGTIYGVKTAKVTPNQGASIPTHLPLTFHCG
jgi:hypothetical protein